MASEVTDASGLIDPEVFPFRSGALWTSLDDVSENARFCRQTGQAVGDASRDAHSVWAGLREHYQAPEGEDLYRSMDPVKASGDREWDVLDQAAGLMDAYVDELMPVRQKLSVLEADALELRTQVVGGVLLSAGEASLTLRAPSPGNEHLSWEAWDTLMHEGGRAPWQHHQLSVERNFVLVAQALGLMEQIRRAGQDLAKGLDELDAGAPLAPTAGPVGSGVYAPGFQPQVSGFGALFGKPAVPDVSGFAPDQAVLGGTAEDVRAWWDALTPAQRSALIAAMPLVIGNLNGVPLKYRAEANTINLKGEIASLRAEQARIDKEMDTVRARRFGRGNYAQIGAELDRLADRRAELDEPIREYEHYLYLDKPQNEYDQNGRKTTRTDVEVVAFDPGAHAIATYHGRYDETGDIGTDVDNLAVYVPGTKTRIDHFNEADTRAYDLYNAANFEHREAGQTAVIAWAGGHFPQLFDAAEARYSQDLAPKLRDFVAAADTQPQASTLTVTGHSYGGAVVGESEQAGLAADRVLYVAGAGIGNANQTVTDFPQTGAVPHYSMMARHDLIVGHIQGLDAGPLGHGTSPLADPAVTRLETGFLTDDKPSSGTIESAGADESHSAVYQRGSTAFNNMVGVITGTEVELFSPDRTQGTRYGGVQWVEGIQHPDYEAVTIDVSEQEQQ